MWIDLDVQLGVNGVPLQFGSIYLDCASINHEAEMLGVYHILSMGEHYDQYVVTPRLLSLPVVAGYPHAPHPYEMMTSKIAAAGVTGNIGEAATACLARRVLELNIADIAHIRPVKAFSRRKAPDYVLRARSRVREVFDIVWPHTVNHDPMWWPTESKARKTVTSAAQGRTDALRQLAAYWYAIGKAQPADVGFGLVVTFQYSIRRRLLVSIIVPRDQPIIQTEIVASVTGNNYRGFVDGFVTNSALMGALHGC